MAEFSGRVYPNGEFTVGVVPRKLQPKDILPVKGEASARVEEVSAALSEFGLEPALAVFGGEAPLGLSSVPISATRSRKGLKGMTSHGKRMVRNGCHLLEQEFGKSRCGFATFTLPVLNFQDWAAVCHDWSVIINNFIKTIKRRLTTRTENPYIVYVTEFQMKRYEKENRFYPHLHICYPARPQRGYQWYISASEMRGLWEQAVHSRCLSSYSFSASVDCVVVKKGLGAYLSKYLSKGEVDIGRIVDSGIPLGCIGHWWGLSGGVREAIIAGTRTCPAIARYLWEHASALREGGGIRWLRYVYIQTRLSGQRCIGMCGCLDGALWAVLQQMYPYQRVVP